MHAGATARSIDARGTCACRPQFARALTHVMPATASIILIVAPRQSCLRLLAAAAAGFAFRCVLRHHIGPGGRRCIGTCVAAAAVQCSRELLYRRRRPVHLPRPRVAVCFFPEPSPLGLGVPIYWRAWRFESGANRAGPTLICEGSVAAAAVLLHSATHEIAFASAHVETDTRNDSPRCESW